MSNLSKDERLMCTWCRQWVPRDTVAQLVPNCTLGVGAQHRGPLMPPESEWVPDRYKLPSNPRLRCKYPNNCDCCRENAAAFAALETQLADQQRSTQNAIDEWQACIAERDRLRAALGQYGQHHPECNLRVHNAHPVKCTCGYDEALAGSPSETSGEQRLTLDTSRQVFFYEQDHYYLSNFSAFRVHWKGINFDTSEAAYHWEKFPDSPVVRREIAHARSAHAAFKIAEESRSLRRADWDDIRVDLMRDILRAKAQQHEYVRRKLLQTGDRELVENSWRDAFWGWGPSRDGQNILGKLWMDVRTELRSATETGENHG